jgi:hypothetical protein
MVLSGSISPASALSQKIIHKRPMMEEGEKRVGPLFERSALRILGQETKHENHLSDSKPAAPVASANGIKKSRPPFFDPDGEIHWVGRTI